MTSWEKCSSTNITRAPLLYFYKELSSSIFLSLWVSQSVRNPWHLSRSPLCSLYKGTNAQMLTQYTASRNAQLSQLDLVLHRALLWRNQPRYILWITTLLCAVVPRAPFIHLQGWQLSNKNTSTGNKLILSILFSFQMYEILNWGTDQIRGIDRLSSNPCTKDPRI